MRITRSVNFCLLLLSSLGLWGLGASEARAGAPKAILLLAVQDDGGTVATFGHGRPVDTLLARIVRAPVEAAGLVFVDALNIPVAERFIDEGLPIADPSALLMARQAGAQLAVIVGVVAQRDGRIRSTPLVGARARVRIRVLDVGGSSAIFVGAADAASYGERVAAALSGAKRGALIKALRGLSGKIRSRWPQIRRVSAGKIVLDIAGVSGWRPISSILRRLAATAGVSDVELVDASPEHALLSVRSQQSAASLAASLRQTSLRFGSLSVRAQGNRLEVTVPSLPTISAPPVLYD